MSDFWIDFFHHPIIRGAITGMVSAAHIDFMAFRSWKSFHDAYSYDWPVALWRWIQGAIVGVVSGGALSWLAG